MKRIWGIFGIALLAVLLAAVPIGTAQADNQKGFYVGVFGGHIFPDDFELEVMGGSYDIDLKQSFMMGAKAGYIFPAFPYVAAEFEYSYMGKQDGTLEDGGIEVAVGDVTLNNLFANLIFRYPGEWIRPYVGAGIGWSWIDVGINEIVQDALGIEDQSDNAWAWQFLMGVNFAIGKNWSADIGYRYFAAENFDVKVEGVNVDAKYKNSTVTVGVNYHF